MQINVTYDASAAAAPAGFQTAVQAAVQYLESVIATPVTINIQFSYGEIAGQPMADDAVGESEGLGSYYTYDQVRAALAATAVTPDDLAALASLPAADPTHGGDFFLNSAQAKALGLYPADAAGVDGYVGLGSSVGYTFDPNNRSAPGLYDAIGVLEHEITEVMGRTAGLGEVKTNGVNVYSLMDLYRYSAAGARQLGAGPGYFSIDGVHLLSKYLNGPLGDGDPGDWASSVVGDSFDAAAGPGEALTVSATDLRLLDILGFHPTAPAPPSTPTTAIPTVAVSRPIKLSHDTTLAAGQSVYFRDGANTSNVFAYTLGVKDTEPGPNFTNDGTITLIGTKIAAAELVAVTGDLNGAFVNDASGKIFVAANAAPGQSLGDYGNAYGFLSTYHGPSFSNAGLIQVVSLSNTATGYWGFNPAAPFINSSTGVIDVWSETTGLGTEFVNGGSFGNAGLIEVTGKDAIAVRGATSFLNTGTITATDILGGKGSIGLEIYGPVATNTGVIQADEAILLDGDFTPSGQISDVIPQMTINNSGKLIGAVVFDDGLTEQLTINNTGSIAGNIYFGDASNVYNGAGGTLTGAIYLGLGGNQVALGDDGETVFGGFGSDTITGGAGNDFIEIGGGHNTIDGGGGFNTLSFADAAMAVRVNLGAGTASVAGTDKIKNIQKVIASDHNDTLIAGSAAAVLVGGAGYDTLEGGAGDDTLIAGTGGDMASGGGGADTFVYAVGDRTLTIRDFAAEDTLDIYGAAAAKSITQSGANTVISLAGGGRIVLDGVKASSLTGDHIVYSAAAYQAAPAPPSPAEYGSSTIYMGADLKIYASETINEQAAPYGFVNQGYSFDNFGKVNVSFPVGALDDAVYGWIDTGTTAFGSAFIDRKPVITNEAGATFSVSDPEGAAYGFFTGVPGNNPETITNVGAVNVSAGGDAYGIQDGGIGVGFDNRASGKFTVTAKGDAYGLYLPNSGAIENDGTITVTGGAKAFGMLGDRAEGHWFINKGTLTVTADPAGQAYGIDVGGLKGVPFGSRYFTVANTGTITAQTAIHEYDDGTEPPQFPVVEVDNSGVINGDIDLAVGDQRINNSGTIVGMIHLNDGDSVYNGAGGQLQGALYLGAGVNTVTLGDDGEVVYAAPDGEADTITGGAGNDFIQLSRGQNTIDGGGGFNILSFANADQGVTVDLGAGTAWADGADSVKHIQEVIGSAFNDTLKAGSTRAELVAGGGDDTLIGGAGDDILVAGTGGATATGGGGNNTFVYSAGDHQLVITDFEANSDKDVLKIYGYSKALSIQQQGADALITLSAIDSILIKNFSASSLASGDIVYRAGQFQTEPTLPPAPPVFGAATVVFNYALKIYAGETVDFSVPVGFLASNYAFGGGFPTFENAGVVRVADTGEVVTGLGYSSLTAGDSSGAAPFQNDKGASFTVIASSGAAYGFDAEYFCPNIVNAGRFTVTGATGATGMIAADGRPDLTVTNARTGVLSVSSSSGAAYGLYVNEAMIVRNQGVIKVSGGTSAYGIWTVENSELWTISNSGVITSTSADGPSYGIDVTGAGIEVDNSGTITATTAVTTNANGGGEFSLANTGVINGDIDLTLWHGRTSISNTGTINGNIELNDIIATVDLRGGTLNGAISIAPTQPDDAATDLIYTDAKPTLIQIHGGFSSLKVTVDGGGATTVQFDEASTAATWSQNADGSWTVNAGTDGTETLTGVSTLVFTDKTVTLPTGAPSVGVVPSDAGSTTAADTAPGTSAGSVSAHTGGGATPVVGVLTQAISTFGPSRSDTAMNPIALNWRPAPSVLAHPAY